MKYSLEPHYRRYIQGQEFMSFARNIGNKYGKKIFDESLDVGKSMKKKVLTKSAETTGDLIDNKIADRITKSATNK